MAFPSVLSSTGYQGPNTDATSWTAFTGVTVSAGDFLVFGCAADGNPTLSTASVGWSLLGHSPGPTVGGLTAIFYKAVAAGGTESLTIASTVAEKFGGILLRIAGATAIGGSSAQGDSTNPDPPLHDAGTVRDHLWIALCGRDVSSLPAVPSAPPAGYGGLTTVVQTNSTGVQIASAYRAVAAQTENPGAFTAVTEQWSSWTLAVWSAAISTTIAVGGASLGLAGQAVPTVKGRTIQIDAGGLTSTGSPTGVIRARIVTIAAAALALTGKPTNLARAYIVNVGAGLLSVVGSPLAIIRARTVPITAATIVTLGRVVAFGIGVGAGLRAMAQRIRIRIGIGI
ncbi:MAG TPA: hypothetical protein VF628_02415 [Allosphingosinicella sp.]|jgi:hypothetical protein